MAIWNNTDWVYSLIYITIVARNWNFQLVSEQTDGSIIRLELLNFHLFDFISSDFFLKIQFLDYAEKLMNNNKIRESIGQAAEAYVRQHHSSEREAETLLKVYQGIVK